MADERLRELERRFHESGLPTDARAWLHARARAGLVPGVGPVFLDDLQAYTSDRAAAWRAERGLDGLLLPPTVAPPSTVIAVATRADSLEVAADWLGMASAVVVVASGDANEVRASFPTAREWIDVGADGPGPAIERALAVAPSIGGEAWRWLPRPAVAPPLDATGPWLPWPTPARDLGELVEELAPRLCAPGGRPGAFLPEGGARLDLLTGARTDVPGLAPLERSVHVAVASSGARWFYCPRHGDPFVLHDGEAPPRESAHGWGRAIGFDLTGQVAWAGARCRFYWRVATPTGLAYWSLNSHEWPCGHGKKLYGHEDNEPRWIHLAADAGACLSVYEHDVLLTPGLPVRWRDLGRVALAERARGEPRALLFQRTEGPDAFPADPLQADEDARDRRATVTLGPSSEARYVVGLDAPTYRLAGGAVTLLGGPADAWVVYDEAHRERQRRPGRLLAGWDRWVVVLHADRLQRIDLETSATEDLGPPGRPISDALAVPGTPHVVLIAQADDQRRELRVV